MRVNLFDLSGKVALVTGGNSGLGLGFARGIAKCGANIVIWGRSASKLASAKAELEQFDVRVMAREVDVADESAVDQGIADAVQSMGRLDCVISNAGIANPAPSFVELDSKRWHDLLATNMHGGFYTMRAAARHMVDRAKAGDPGGSIVVCGSLSIFKGVPGMEHYGAAKAGLAAVMAGMAQELGKHGIRVNMVAPGYIKTELSRDGDPASTAAMDSYFAQNTPIPRVGYPEDFEGVMAYLASDASRFHTGDIIVIDGGWMIRL